MKIKIPHIITTEIEHARKLGLTNRDIVYKALTGKPSKLKSFAESNFNTFMIALAIGYEVE
ncbi:hypothetical protein MOE86_11750 [Bacillus atrophaeus]|uniref:hypothetical protein n=1 Tax=Bacillus atrophaeus TaxID=1452 RepID=UPI00227E6155|nr:hypothetical protein [Bacillus atrophaeus]MCY9197377.1 hypothetical protein [Bacillus atrophaeus]